MTCQVNFVQYINKLPTYCTANKKFTRYIKEQDTGYLGGGRQGGGIGETVGTIACSRHTTLVSAQPSKGLWRALGHLVYHTRHVSPHITNPKLLVENHYPKFWCKGYSPTKNFASSHSQDYSFYGTQSQGLAAHYFLRQHFNTLTNHSHGATGFHVINILKEKLSQTNLKHLIGSCKN